MTCYINGTEVTYAVYDRDRNDNFNCGIAFTEVATPNTLTMTYKED